MSKPMTHLYSISKGADVGEVLDSVESLERRGVNSEAEKPWLRNLRARPNCPGSSPAGSSSVRRRAVFTVPHFMNKPTALSRLMD